VRMSRSLRWYEPDQVLRVVRAALSARPALRRTDTPGDGSGISSRLQSVKWSGPSGPLRPGARTMLRGWPAHFMRPAPVRNVPECGHAAPFAR
jgi:hypothetical protein